MAELVDALDLGSSVFGREGSSPFIRMIYGFIDRNIFFLKTTKAEMCLKFTHL